MLTPQYIIDIVCQALELDIDKMSIKGKQINQKYRDARLIAVYLMRERIVEDRVVMSKIEGKRVYVEATKPITFREISLHLNRKKPHSAMASALACRDLLKSDKIFRIKYQTVLELLDKNGDIKIQTQTNG